MIEKEIMKYSFCANAEGLQEEKERFSEVCIVL